MRNLQVYLEENIPFREQISFEREKVKVLSPKYLESDQIALAFPIELRKKYLQGLTKTERRNLNNGYALTARWKNDSSLIEYPDWFEENDLEHVVKLLNWVNECEEKYPNLIADISDNDSQAVDDLRIMLAAHDFGEAIVGDWVATLPDQKEKERHKKKEARAAWLAISSISNGEVRSKVFDCFNRFEHKDPNDKLVQFGHLLDKADASIQVTGTLIPYNIEIGHPKYAGHCAKRLEEAVARPLQFADRINELVGGEAQNELVDFCENEILSTCEMIEDPRICDILQNIRSKYKLFV